MRSALPRHPKADSADHPNIVVILMDGKLADRDDNTTLYKAGIEVVKKIMGLSQENNWALPFFIGGSSDSWKNDEIAKAYPDQYLDDDQFSYRKVPEAIQNKVFNK